MNFYDLTIPNGSDFSKSFTMKQNGIPMDLSGYSASMYIVLNTGELSSTVFSGSNLVNGMTNGTLTLQLSPDDIDTISGKFYKIEIDNGSIQTTLLTGNIFILDEDKSGIEYLIPILRLQLGDTNPLTYRYLDEWLLVALQSSVKALQRWWSSRYTVDDVTGRVSRGSDYTFAYDEPPVIQGQDERPVILMASILVKSGQLEGNSWNVGSWKDAEIAVSNIEGNRSKEFGVKMDWEELKGYMLPPSRRLSGAIRIAHPVTEE